MSEKRMRAIVDRFSVLDDLMLYWIVKSFKAAGEGIPAVNPAKNRALQSSLSELYEESGPEAEELIKEGYLKGYRRDKRHDKTALALLVGIIFLRSGEAAMSPQGHRAVENTKKAMRSAVSLLPLQFQKAQLQAVNHATALYNRGGITRQQAKQRALNALANKGVVHFVDQGGRRWGLDRYVDMALRTGYASASRAGFLASLEGRGKDLVYVSAHFGSCPLCVPWEGVMLSASGNDRRYPSLQEATASGLFHPNCRHVPLDYIEGHSELIRYDSPENEQRYHDEQRQRAMERNVRQWKRREIAAISPQEKALAENYKRKWQGELREFTREKGLSRKYYREAVGS